MVIVRLFGGLGNQMFQYVAGRRLAHLRQVDLKLDLSWFESCGLRTYSLGNFNIRENIASAEEIRAFLLNDVKDTEMNEKLPKTLGDHIGPNRFT